MLLIVEVFRSIFLIVDTKVCGDGPSGQLHQMPSVWKSLPLNKVNKSKWNTRTSYDFDSFTLLDYLKIACVCACQCDYVYIWRQDFRDYTRI